MDNLIAGTAIITQKELDNYRKMEADYSLTRKILDDKIMQQLEVKKQFDMDYQALKSEHKEAWRKLSAETNSTHFYRTEVYKWHQLFNDFREKMVRHNIILRELNWWDRLRGKKVYMFKHDADLPAPAPYPDLGERMHGMRGIFYQG